MQIYLANAALKAQGFDLAATVELAARERCAGVQLYVNEHHREPPGRLEVVARAAREAGLGVMVHLPPEVTGGVIRAARRLLRFEQSPRALIHYDPARPIPRIDGVQIGLENAVQGLDERYYERLRAARRERDTFLAFDLPRLFGRDDVDLEAAYGFAEQTLDGLRPDDVLHLIDQRRRGSRRADWCTVGEGLVAPLLPRIVSHPGAIVLEFETVGHALASKNALEAARALHPPT